MKPKRIILARHGESEANFDKHIRSVKPDHLMLLTQTGKDQADKLGKNIKKIIGDEKLRVYLSPYMRTRHTFNEIEKYCKENIVKTSEDPRIREQDFGHLRPADAHDLIDAERTKYGTFFFRVPDGESGADLYDRMSSFLDTLWRDFEKPDYPDNALIISHGLTIRLFCMRWFHWSVEDFEKLRNPRNCEHFVLELNGNDKYQLMTPFRVYSADETKQWKESGK